MSRASSHEKISVDTKPKYQRTVAIDVRNSGSKEVIIQVEKRRVSVLMFNRHMESDAIGVGSTST